MSMRVSHGPQAPNPKVRQTVAKNLYRHIPSGRFEVGYRDPASGRWIMKRLDARNVTEAKRQVREILGKVETGELRPADRSVRLGDLVDAFLAHERSGLGSRAPRTVDLYEQRLRKYVLTLLGARTRIADITVAHIRHQLIDEMRRQKIGASTIRGTIAAFSSVCRFAVRNETIPRNPVRDLDRGDLPPLKRSSEPRYLTVDQVEELLKTLGDEFRPVAATLFYAALRISEGLSLTWAHLNFETHVIAVPGTKTASSAQTVPLLPALERELRAHRSRQARRNVAFLHPDALVFVTPSGKSPGRRNVLRAVQHAADRAGLNPDGVEPVGLHDLRHSAAGLAFNALPLNEVSRLLRHANARVTATVYAGLSDEAAAAIGTKLTTAGFGN
jgi:integrase